MTKRNNPIIGELKYENYWYQVAEITVFRQKLETRLVFDGLKGDGLTSQQQESAQWFNQHQVELSSQFQSAVSEHLQTIANEIAPYFKNQKLPTNINELLKLENVFFKQDGSFAYLFKTAWDEAGIVCLFNQAHKFVQIGTQDILS